MNDHWCGITYEKPREYLAISSENGYLGAKDGIGSINRIRVRKMRGIAIKVERTIGYNVIRNKTIVWSPAVTATLQWMKHHCPLRIPLHLEYPILTCRTMFDPCINPKTLTINICSVASECFVVVCSIRLPAVLLFGSFCRLVRITSISVLILHLPFLLLWSVQRAHFLCECVRVVSYRCFYQKPFAPCLHLHAKFPHTALWNIVGFSHCFALLLLADVHFCFIIPFQQYFFFVCVVRLLLLLCFLFSVFCLHCSHLSICCCYCRFSPAFFLRRWRIFTAWLRIVLMCKLLWDALLLSHPIHKLKLSNWRSFLPQDTFAVSYI